MPLPIILLFDFFKEVKVVFVAKFGDVTFGYSSFDGAFWLIAMEAATPEFAVF